VGIDPELRDKIFDPYISSKSSGMGLGLAIVRRIAEEHSGSVTSELASGARFVFDLPRWGQARQSTVVDPGSILG